MNTSKMPPGLRRYWRTHKRPGAKKTTIKRRRRSSGHTARAHHRTHRACGHAMARQVISNVRGVLWCPTCGSLCDRHRWHRPRG